MVEVSKRIAAFSLAASLAGLAGCNATLGGVTRQEVAPAPAQTQVAVPRSENLTVVNPPQTQGVAAYGSEACRKAGVDPIKAADFTRAGSIYSRGPYTSFYRGYRSNPTVQQNVTVTDNRGTKWVLVPEEKTAEKTTGALLQIAGAAGGAAVASEALKGQGSTVRGLGTIAAGALGAAATRIIGGTGASGPTREAFERCRYDVSQGAYADGVGSGVTPQQPATPRNAPTVPYPWQR